MTNDSMIATTINLDNWSDTLTIDSNSLNSNFSFDDFTIAGLSAESSVKISSDDIVIKGRSLMETLATIEQRLNILQPNPELEAEWLELKELGQRYRQLEAELLEKQKMWATLKR